MDLDDDYSDLTDIESEEDYAPNKRAAKAKKQAKPYKLTKTLTAPRATTYAAQALYDQMHDQAINLDAEYQRDVVWPDSKQIGLVDSIFRNFYVPPVIFAAKVDEDGTETKICIDGKQRLTSIRRFMDGLIPHRDSTTAEKLFYKDNPGVQVTKKKILPENLRKSFANKQIVCVEYQGITDSDEREIFQRVQLGMALTAAEKLQSINSPRVAFIRRVQAKYIRDGGLADLDWDVSRGGDFRCLSQAIWTIDKFTPTLKNVGTITQLEKWLALDNLSSESEQAIDDTFRIFSDLVQDPKLGKVFKKPAKTSPIEFLVIALLIHNHRKKLSHSQLSSAIGAMREAARKEHVDIRMNNRVAKTLIDFVRDLKVSKVGGEPGPAASTVSAPSGKRKRNDTDNSDESDAGTDESGDEEDENTDYRPSTSKKKAAKKSKPTPTLASIIKMEPKSVLIPVANVPLPVPAAQNRLAGLRAAQTSMPSPSLPSIPRYPASTSAPIVSPSSTPQLPTPSSDTFGFAFPNSLNAVANSSYNHSVSQGTLQQSSQPPLPGPSSHRSGYAGSHDRNRDRDQDGGYRDKGYRERDSGYGGSHNKRSSYDFKERERDSGWQRR